MAIERKIVPLFGVYVWFCDDPEDARRFLGEYDEDPATADELVKCRGFCSRLSAQDGREASLMCVLDQEDLLAIAAHEAVHAAWMILRHCKVRVKAETDEEMLAYLVSWFTAEFIRFAARGQEQRHYMGLCAMRAIQQNA